MKGMPLLTGFFITVYSGVDMLGVVGLDDREGGIDIGSRSRRSGSRAGRCCVPG